MRKFLLSTGLGLIGVCLVVTSSAKCDYDYAAETQRAIMNYGYFGDQLPSINDMGSDENFESWFQDDKVYFDYKRSSLDRHEKGEKSIITITQRRVNYNKSVLDRQAKYLKENPFTDVHIIGYTDPRGSHAANKKLALKRAEVVKKYLVKQGIDPNRLHPVGVGEDIVNFNGNADNRTVDSNLQD